MIQAGTEELYIVGDCVESVNFSGTKNTHYVTRVTSKRAMLSNGITIPRRRKTSYAIGTAHKITATVYTPLKS